MSLHADWIVPDWPVPPNVLAVCTTRAGGVSQAPYDSLNLGDHVGDDPACVARNRAIFERAIGARPVFLRQVHGSDGALALDGLVEDGAQGDACWTTARALACTIMVADCLPILLAAEDGSRIGAAHAGWRGACGGIVESAVREMSLAPAALIAWLGPCIGPEAFEVGPEVKAAFEAKDAAAHRYFQPQLEGKWLADLPALVRMRLQALGVERVHGNDGTRGWCTVANASRFFSHRRDRVSGRFAAAVWRT